MHKQCCSVKELMKILKGLPKDARVYYVDSYYGDAQDLFVNVLNGAVYFK